MYEKVIHKHIMAELPFMATENIIMECVKAGGDRQELHERIRVHSMDSGKRVKEGLDNDLIERIKSDPLFAAVHDRLDNMLDPKAFTGRAKEQVERFLSDYIKPILNKHSADLEFKSVLNV